MLICHSSRRGSGTWELIYFIVNEETANVPNRET
jgi:hypothetical protein